MQEIYPRLDIQIVGINEYGHEIGNSQITSGRDLPWLQDLDQNGDRRSDVWDESWSVTFRDVIILDGANRHARVFNLTTHNLADPANQQALQDLLVETAVRDQQPWCNPRNTLDVNDDGSVDAEDAQLLIDVMNQSGAHRLPQLADGATPPAFYDCNMDGFLAPGDALQIINLLNSQQRAGQAGEGESGPLPGPESTLPSGEHLQRGVNGTTLLVSQGTPPETGTGDQPGDSHWQSADPSFDPSAAAFAPRTARSEPVPAGHAWEPLTAVTVDAVFASDSLL